MNVHHKCTAPLLFVMCLICPLAFAGMEDDPLLSMVKTEEFEWQKDNDESVLAWDVQGWTGYDLNKFRWKTEGRAENGAVEEYELQLLYSRAVAPYWDMNVGLRTDPKPSSGRNWAVFGVQGVAPYQIDVEASLFMSPSGHTELRLEAHYELMFTQKLVLAPVLEISLFNRDDPQNETGGGLSDAEFGLRLRYDLRRELAPYIGVNWHRKFGNAAKFAEMDGHSESETEVVMGVHFWF